MTGYSRGSVGEVPTMVAIPARDEAQHIAKCLDAFAAQRDEGGGPLRHAAPFKVLVLINNTTDDTAARLERWRLERRRAGRPFPVAFRQVELRGEAHAGAARGAAMDWALEELHGITGGVICTTDADSEVDPAWLRNTWAAFRTGIDAVAGAIDFDPEQLAALPLSPLRRLEARHAALQAQLAAELDPEPHNPWPNHIWAWGASLAVTASAYRRIGGLPRAPLAEDRALVAALEERDFKVRHSLEVRVRTSLRPVGRAPGGLADLVKVHASGDDAYPCDAALRPVVATYRQATCRRRLRRARQARTPEVCRDLALRLRLPHAAIDRAVAEPCFGAAWRALEASSPVLASPRLFPRDLPEQISLAGRVLSALGRCSAERPADSVLAASAGLWSPSLQPAE